MNFFRKLSGNRVFQYVAIALLAIGYALVNEIFILPNHFAPSGINGVATMIQYLFRFSVGYLTLIINLPMLVVAFFVLKRDYACKSLLFTITMSLAMLILEHFDLFGIPPYVTGDGDTGGGILAAIAGGLFNGTIFSFAIRLGGSTGGTDVIAAFINHKYPEFDTVWIIFTLNVIVAGVSYFVYGMQYTPVILCAIYAFLISRISDSIFKGAKTAAKFEVITTRPDEISKELLEKLHHGCTVIPAEGVYTHTKKSMLVCVVNRRQIVDFERIVRKYDGTFAYISTVNGTIGRFSHVK